ELASELNAHLHNKSLLRKLRPLFSLKPPSSQSEFEEAAKTFVEISIRETRHHGDEVMLADDLVAVANVYSDRRAIKYPALGKEERVFPGPGNKSDYLRKALEYYA